MRCLEGRALLGKRCKPAIASIDAHLDAGRADDAERLVAEHLRGPGQLYFLLLGVEIARARRQDEQVLARLKSIVAAMPHEWSFVDRVALMAYGGNVDGAVALLEKVAADTEIDPPVIRALEPILRSATKPEELAPVNVRLVERAPAESYGGFYRLTTLAEIIGDLPQIRAEGSGPLRDALVSAFLRLAGEKEQKGCDRGCMTRTLQPMCPA